MVSFLYMEPSLPLEDTKEDVLTKALHAYSVKESQIPSTKAGYRVFLQEVLQLDPVAFENLDSYRPICSLPEGIKQHVFPFYSTSLNIWSITYPDGVVIVDAGLRQEHMEQVISDLGINHKNAPLAVLITHGHHDHIGGLTAIPFCPIICAGTENIACITDSVFDFNIAFRPWTICRLPGHSDDSIGFKTIFNDQPIFFVGDSIFAGSLGSIKRPEDTRESLSNLLTVLRDLPDHTIILSGHGPPTILGQEWEHNPFLRGKKQLLKC